LTVYESIKVGKRGTVVIPAGLRRDYLIDEGSMLVAEARPEGILLRRAAVIPLEMYTPERKAEFLLNNAITGEDYAWAVQKVREMGLDPDKIGHQPPERM
jgi:AbrB family looped-hinge helix DNA binding protein